MIPMITRACLLDDLDAIAAMCQLWQAEDITRNYRADSVPELRSRISEFFLVAELDGRLVGFLIAQPKPTGGDEIDGAFIDPQSHYLDIQDLYVLPDIRGRGVGSALMRAVVTHAKARNLRCSMVYSANKDYAQTARFYEKCGYKMWHIFMTREE
jgi:GNAT superfamily N-acetyltransferase